MAAKQLLFDEAARQAILRGITKLSKAVTATLGPKGRNVVIDKKYGSPTVTKDGVTVAKEIELEDAYENMGAQMVREVASKTSDTAGDGTTTATVLAEAIYREGLKFVTSGANPIGIQRGINKAVEAAVGQLDKITKKVKDKDEIRQVAAVSANWDFEIADKIAEAMDKVGKDGTITVEEDQIRMRGLPRIPGASRFPELNLRTYVRERHTNQPGVYFFSLDAANPFAVSAARIFFRLPYYWAHMKIESDESRGIHYRSDRLLSRRSAHFRAQYRSLGKPCVKGGIESFLT